MSTTLVQSNNRLAEVAESHGGREVAKGEKPFLDEMVIRTTDGSSLRTFAFPSPTEANGALSELVGLADTVLGPERWAVNYETIGRIAACFGGRELKRKESPEAGESPITVKCRYGGDRRFVFSDRESAKGAEAAIRELEAPNIESVASGLGQTVNRA